MPVVFAQHESWSDSAQIVAEQIVLRSGNGMFHAVRFDSILANSEANVGSKTCSGLTYLELVLIDIVGLSNVSEVTRASGENDSPSRSRVSCLWFQGHLNRMAPTLAVWQALPTCRHHRRGRRVRDGQHQSDGLRDRACWSGASS
jgi:hypothetical protein